MAISRSQEKHFVPCVRFARSGSTLAICCSQSKHLDGLPIQAYSGPARRIMSCSQEKHLVGPDRYRREKKPSRERLPATAWHTTVATIRSVTKSLKHMRRRW